MTDVGVRPVGENVSLRGHDVRTGSVPEDARRRAEGAPEPAAAETGTPTDD